LHLDFARKLGIDLLLVMVPLQLLSKQLKLNPLLIQDQQQVLERVQLYLHPILNIDLLPPMQLGYQLPLPLQA